MESPPSRSRKGSRRAPSRRRRLDRRGLALLGGAVVAVLAWVLLVYAGIRFGQSARGGDGAAWLFMLIAALGAVACLFLALMMASRVLRSLGVAPRAPLRPVVARGGRRAGRRRSRLRH